MGKTTLALNLTPRSRRYLNWDVLEDREFILAEKFPHEKVVVFDEVHKFHNWRNYIKGFYDTSKIKARRRILVTGSARLDYYRHSGDSLLGRYYHYRLHPFSAKELGLKTQKEINDLLVLGGFPEAYLSGSQQQAARWQRMHSSLVINEEVRALEQSLYLSQMQQLALRLPALVGSPLSINALREDLQLAHGTVAKYLDIFERLYLIYRIKAFSSNKMRVVKKEQKHYHYNWAVVPSKGAGFENLVAGHLLKWVHWQQDAMGEDFDLCYFRDVSGREIDFVLTHKGVPVRAIECKVAARSMSPHLAYFKERFPECECLQVHLEKAQSYTTKRGVQSVHWPELLGQLI